METKTISTARRELSEDLEFPGITAITRNGNFSGVLISMGEQEDDTAERFLQRIQQNSKVGINQLRKKAIEES